MTTGFDAPAWADDSWCYKRNYGANADQGLIEFDFPAMASDSSRRVSMQMRIWMHNIGAATLDASQKYNTDELHKWRYNCPNGAWCNLLMDVPLPDGGRVGINLKNIEPNQFVKLSPVNTKAFVYLTSVDTYNNSPNAPYYTCKSFKTGPYSHDLLVDSDEIATDQVFKV